MSEFGEPWKRIGNEVVSHNGDVVLDVVVRTSRFEQICLDDNEVARIVACVNFCQHFSTEFVQTHRLYKADKDDKGRTYLSDIPDFSGVVPCLPLVEAEKFERKDSTDG